MMKMTLTWSKLNIIRAGLKGIGAENIASFCRQYRNIGKNGGKKATKISKKTKTSSGIYLEMNRDSLENQRVWKPAAAVVPAKQNKPPVLLNMDSMQAENLNRVLEALDVSSEVSSKEEQSEVHQEETSNVYSQTLLSMEDTDFKKAYMDNVHTNLLRNEGIQTMTTELNPRRLKACSNLDERLREEMIKKQQSTMYKNMLENRQRLPAYQMRNEITELVKNNQVILLTGETGCGKTTQVPQFLLDSEILAGRGSVCNVVCTQPRRISAVSIARRVAEERAEQLGKSVGYQIRLEAARARDRGSIMYCTTGIVLQWLQGDQHLNSVSHLVLDEIHERDMQSDFLITIARDLLPRRPDLKLILMSATLNAEQFSEYYGGCAMIHIPGFTFPVKEYYLEDIIEMTRFQYPPEPKALKRPGGRGKRSSEADEEDNHRSSFHDQVLPWLGVLDRNRTLLPVVVRELAKPCSEQLCPALIVRLLRHICQQGPGAVLVFLPGWGDISLLDHLIKDDPVIASQQTLVLPLHSRLTSAHQSAVFNRPPPGVRKIVLATNIAETSITIDDIVYVIDSGFSNVRHFDKDAKLASLGPEWLTQANAHQRRGRAGRVQAGICYHLFSRKRHALLAPRPLPEVGRVRLEGALLQVKALGQGYGHRFMADLMDPPHEQVVEMALQVLEAINALDEDENLTPLGFHLAKLPVDPLTGRMLLMAAIFSCLDPILTVAAVLSFKEPFITAMGREQKVDDVRARLSGRTYSDHLLHARVYDTWREAERRGDQGFCKAAHLSPSALHQISALRQDFFTYLKERQLISRSTTSSRSPDLNRHSSNVPLLRAVIAAGLYPNVARVDNTGFNRHQRLRLSTADHREVVLHPNCVNAHPLSRGCKHFPWMVFREQMKLSKVFLFDATCVPNFPLLLFGQHLTFDEQDGVLDVDGFVRVHCSPSVASVIRRLRLEVDVLLEHKLSHPGPTQWAGQEGRLLNTIVNLLNSEDTLTSGTTVERVREKV